MIDGAINPDLDINPESLLGRPISAEDYVPHATGGHAGMSWFAALMNRNRPIFNYYVIVDMLQDPRVTFGLMLLKGPIVSNPTYEINCNNSAVTEFLDKNIRRFWTYSAERVMRAIEWGFSGSEILYRRDPEDGLIYFDDVRDFHSLDCRPVIHHGAVVGFRYRSVIDASLFGMTAMTQEDVYKKSKTEGKYDNDPTWKYLGAPKALWHLHNRARNPWFGLSRLYGPHVPWYEMWSEDGWRNICRLWFSGCVFDGGVMYHPPGMVAVPNGPPMPARDYAREMIEKKRTGAVLTLPNQPSGDGGEQAWLYQKPEGNPTPAGLLERGEGLRSEIFEALGIPPEVIQSSGDSGFGSASGRQVPQMAYNSILLSLAMSLLLDFDKYCLRYLVATQFGPVSYELLCRPLDEVKQDPNDPNGDNTPNGTGDEEVDENGEPIEDDENKIPPE